MTDFKRYGWKTNDINLNTLPDTAPMAAKELTKWLTLQGRRSTLEEYLKCVEDGVIHGKFWHIGAWTQRMSHSNPNQANIPSVFSGEPTTPVEEVKHRYDGAIRECFYVDNWLVGTDADAIQLRVLAHYMKSDEYVDAIVNGDKSKGTDIHSLNKRALGPVCRDRDTAKTFIYAWLLGAGLPKIAEILGCSIPQAKSAVNSFIEAYPGLKKLKEYEIPRDAARGYFIGLDGREVPCSSEHLMLAGYLQNGESIIMKKATVNWKARLDKHNVKYWLRNFVHDEWQTEVAGSRDLAHKVGVTQSDALRQVGEELGLFCPLSGTFSLGRNWKETH